MPVDARMRLESVSKIWTAVLVLQLAEHGRLSLNDTVERWLPGLLPFGDRITLRQLLTHTSGLFDNNDAVNHPARVLARVKDPVFQAELLRLAKRLQADPTLQFPPTVWIRLAATQPLYFPPGTGYHYSNVGFEVLGLVIEQAIGQPWRRSTRSGSSSRSAWTRPSTTPKATSPAPTPVATWSTGMGRWPT
jgi:D-alanyl-D-alanine carboxypeptidase